MSRETKGEMTINNNAALTSLAGLASLASIGGTLTIDSNATLATLGMPALVTCANDFVVTLNPALSLSGQINPLLAQLTALPVSVDTLGNAP